MNPLKSLIKAPLKSYLKFSAKTLEWATKRGILFTKFTYSQFGEDLIVEGIFSSLHISHPTYLDIGASEPDILSNTWLLYQRGSRGVLVEPDPLLAEKIKKLRKDDVCLSIGAGGQTPEELDFYVMDAQMLSTFSKEEAQKYEEKGYKIKEVKKIPVVPVNEIISKNCIQCPNFISLDVEGLEMKILSAFDFSTYRPEVWCIETYSYALDKKEDNIIQFMLGKGYMLYADTRLNSIFVDQKKWEERKR